MSLSGNLSEFSLADTLMLLAQQKKNGKLSLQQDDKLGELFIRAGHVVSIKVQGRTPEVLIANALAARGVTTGKSFQTLAHSSRASELKLSSVLISKNFLDAEECELWFRAAAEDLVYELFTWKQGRYEFEAEVFKGAENLLEYDLPIEFLALEALREMDEKVKVFEPFTEHKQWISIANPEYEDYDMGEDLYILRQVASGIALAKLKERFPFSNFRIYSKLEHLRKEGFLQFRALSAGAERKKVGFSLLEHPWLFIFLSLSLLFVVVALRLSSLKNPNQTEYPFLKLSRSLKNSRQEALLLEYATRKLHIPIQSLQNVRN